MKLTPDQQLAAWATDSVAVTAGAGTGKTSMLAARYLFHVREQSMSPLSVVAVTFTDKAADELRARIRKTLTRELGDEKLIAEVEAAQISTIHALASRICRDFYDLARIPADFTVLDETDMPLWSAQKFDAAVSRIDPSITDQLGYSWLVKALEVLLKDPFSSEKALSLGADNWREAIEREHLAAVAGLTSSTEWIDAETILHAVGGTPGDKLEEARSDAIDAMDDIRQGNDIRAAFTVLSKVAAHQGQAGNWPPGGKQLIGECLKTLKHAAKELLPRVSLEFGLDDEEAALRIAPLAAAFRQVRDEIAAEKLREKVLDFSDLEHYALKILDHAEAVEHYALRWKAVLVDEFQDTNPIQAEILARLTQKAKLTIVGDEKQAIYGFRGADIGVFSRVREQIVAEHNGVQVPLSLTFRTHHELTVTMNALFEPVLGDLHQSLNADRRDVPLAAPHLYSAVVGAEDKPPKSKLQVIEARYIAGRIRELYEAGVPYRDMAIISRTWAPLEVYLDVLSAMKIPAVHAGGGSLLETREALDIYSLLSFLTEPNDDIPLVAVLRSPFFAMSDIELYNASQHWASGVSWWQMISTIPQFDPAVGILNELIDAHSSLSAEKIVQLADRLTGYGAVVANLPHGARRAADLRGILELFRKLERQGKGDIFGTTRHLREWMIAETDIPRPPLDVGEAVSLMTIHKAKGLEWPVVFIPDLARDRKNTYSPILIDPDVGVAFQMETDGFEKAEPAIHKLIKLRIKEREDEETRRLLYVAVTRARDKVFLTATKEKGYALDILRPGIEAAGIIGEIIPYDDALALPPSPAENAPFAVPAEMNVEAVLFGPRELPVTALTTYAKCPLRFRFQFVDGHPGVSEGFANAMAIGSLTHLALEIGAETADSLRREAVTSTDEQIAEAVRLANSFRTSPNFAAVHSSVGDREVEFLKEVAGVKLHGIADLVGQDFVLDYKTDAEPDPNEHRFQLWAYAEALQKPRAMIAYLRKDILHTWETAELRDIGVEAQAMIMRIRSADYTAAPSEKNCGYCPYNSICPSSAV